jgi:HAMP domain-containing protein
MNPLEAVRDRWEKGPQQSGITQLFTRGEVGELLKEVDRLRQLMHDHPYYPLDWENENG